MNIKGSLAIAKGKAAGIHLLYPEVYKFPVHPSVAARKLGIHVFCEDTNLYKYFDYDLEAKRIYINSNLSRRKLRYSIALALGHVLMEHDSMYAMIPQYLEEADIFASNLTVPREMLYYRLENGASLIDLVKYFDVDKSIIVSAIEDLGIIEKSWNL